MPTVQIPRYGGPKVKTAPIPGARKTAAETPESLGAGVERARAQKQQGLAQFAMGTLSEIDKVVQAERQRADDVALLAAENEAAFRRTQLLWGPGGVYNTFGKDAMALPDAVKNEWNKTTGDIEAKLSSDEQRMRWREFKQKADVEIDLAVQRHVSEQRQSYQAEELQKGLDNRVSFAVANYADLAIVGSELESGRELIRTHGKQLGKGEETIKANLLSFTTQVHSGVIANLIDNHESAKAQVYAEAVVDEMDGEAQAKVDRAIKQGTKTEKAQAATERILGSYKTLEEQRAAAKRELSGELEEDVLKNLEHEHALARGRKRENEEDALDKAKALLDRSRRPSLQDIPSELMTAITDAGLKSVVSDYLDKLVQAKPVDTDETLYDHLITLMRSPNPDDRHEFADTNLMSLMNRLSTHDRRQLREWQLELRTTGSISPERVATEGAISQMTGDALTSIGLDPSPPAPGTKDPKYTSGYSLEEVNEAVNLFRRRVRTDVAVLGDKPPVEQVQAIVDYWSGVLNKELHETSDTPLLQRLQNLNRRRDIRLPNQPITLDDLPGADRVAIEERLRRAGSAVTPTSIIKMYREVLRLRAEGR